MRFTVFRWSSVVLVTLLAGVCTAQDSTKRNDRPKSEAEPTTVIKNKDADTARYTWEFAQPQFVINHIVVEHDALGHGKVSFDRKAETDTVVEPVELSPSVLEKLDRLWRALKGLLD